MVLLEVDINDMLMTGIKSPLNQFSHAQMKQGFQEATNCDRICLCINLRKRWASVDHIVSPSCRLRQQSNDEYVEHVELL